MAFGGSGGAGAIRAGAAFVEILGKDAGLRAALERSRKLVAGFGSVVSGAANLLRGFGERLVSVGTKAVGLGLLLTAPFAAAIKHFAGFGDSLTKMSERTGISVEALSELSFAAGQSATSLEDIERFIFKMDDALLKAGDGAEEARQAVQRLGLSVEDLASKSVEERFMAIAEAISRVKDAGDRAAIAKAIGGRGGPAELALFKPGRLAALRAEARALGITISSEQARNATEVAEAWDRAWSTIKRAGFAAGEALAPALLEITDRLTQGGKLLTAFLSENKQLVVAAAGVAIGLIAGGAALIVLGKVAIVAAAGLSIVGSVLGGIASVVGFLMTPLGLVTAAVVALGGAFVVSWAKSGDGVKLLHELGAAFGELWTTIVEGAGGVGDALRANDWPLAGAIAMKTLELVFQQGKVSLLRIWDDLLESLRHHWVIFWGGIGTTGASAWDKLNFQMEVSIERAKEWLVTHPQDRDNPERIAAFNRRMAERWRTSWYSSNGAIPFPFADTMPLTAEGVRELQRRQQAAQSGAPVGPKGTTPGQDALDDAARRGHEVFLERQGLGSRERDDKQNAEAIAGAVAAAVAGVMERIKPASPEVERLQRELRELLDRAAAGRAAKENADAAAGAAGEAATRVMAMIHQAVGGQIAALPGAVKGAFGGENLQQRFGVGDTAGKRLLDANERTAENTGKIIDAVKGLPSGIILG